MNKKVIVPALVLGAATAVGALSYVSATSAAGNGFRGEMASNLAQKLGVEESQVETAMSEMKEEKMAEIKKQREEKLQEAVDDGVITSEQKEALVAHQDEMQQKREQLREESERWFEESGIDKEALKEYMGGEGRGFKKGKRGI